MRGDLFNVFDVLDRAKDEVKCHSALLGQLIDDTGSHGQGGRFCKALIEVLNSRLVDEDKALIATGQKFWVGTEVPFDYKDDQVHAPFIMRRRGGSP